MISTIDLLGCTGPYLRTPVAGDVQSQGHGHRAVHLADLPEAHALVEAPCIVVDVHAQAQRRQPLLTGSGNQRVEQAAPDPRFRQACTTPIDSSGVAASTNP